MRWRTQELARPAPKSARRTRAGACQEHRPDTFVWPALGFLARARKNGATLRQLPGAPRQSPVRVRRLRRGHQQSQGQLEAPALRIRKWPKETSRECVRQCFRACVCACARDCVCVCGKSQGCSCGRYSPCPGRPSTALHHKDAGATRPGGGRLLPMTHAGCSRVNPPSAAPMGPRGAAQRSRGRRDGIAPIRPHARPGADAQEATPGASPTSAARRLLCTLCRASGPLESGSPCQSTICNRAACAVACVERKARQSTTACVVRIKLERAAPATATPRQRRTLAIGFRPHSKPKIKEPCFGTGLRAGHTTCCRRPPAPCGAVTGASPRSSR